MTARTLPRVFLIRHGETEWTINGRHTGTTDLPLTENGEAIITRLGEKIAGQDKLIDPTKLSTVIVSPRLRAQRTFELLFASSPTKPEMNTDERVQEWVYGEYEGKLKKEVVQMRKDRDIPSGEGGWDIWHDGCEGGESAEEMQARVDTVIKAIRDAHKSWWTKSSQAEGPNVLIVSHGHFSRCFLARWLNLPLADGQKFILNPGGVCIAQYYHDLDHPAVGSINLGLI